MQSKEVDGYINSFEGEVHNRLVAVRELIRESVPDAAEVMAYGLAAYKLNGKPLVYFGGFKNHVGLYATPNGHDAFRDDFSKYTQGKGSVQFPNNQPLPIDLIKRVIAYRKTQVVGG